jgi:hypothetical protein
MEVRELLFGPGSGTHLARHGISIWEALELIQLNEWVPYEHPAYSGQARLVGRTRAGRIITLVVAPTDDPTLWRAVTGWDASPTERAYYWGEDE